MIAMAYCAVPLERVSLPLGKGGHIYNAAEARECLIASLFRKVYINGQKVDYPFIMVLVKEESNSHFGRRSIKYSDKNTYIGDGESYSNQVFLGHARETLGIGENSCWFVYGIETQNQDELHLYAAVVNETENVVYNNSTERKNRWLSLIPEYNEYQSIGHRIFSSFEPTDVILNKPHFLPYLTALRTKPFMLLAGISGTGKSRIVREMAKACWTPNDDEYWKDKEKQIRNNHPRNFCMVQVKPNWHDSTELIGYVTRISGTPEYIPGPFLRFLAAAIKEPEVPYFLCLDEMNLAPVEQYFAEYLSVIESRKLNPDGTITTDPIINPEDTQEYHDLIGKLLGDEERLKGTTLSIPQNLFVVGTVNMDETTFSFSRKVLDRAMTIEMNEVNLHGGLEKGAGNEIGYIGNSIIGDAAEGCDIYEDNKELCDDVLAYLENVNAILEGTPFKIAYRTRNEFLMYAVNRQKLAPESQLWQGLDEMTSMKILSRIEGDEERTKRVLEGLKTLVKDQIVDKIGESADGTSALPGSISAAKIEEMLAKLKATGFTSYWA